MSEPNEMRVNYIEKEYGGHLFKFVKTPTAPALIEEIFNDNYEIFKQNIEIRPGDVILDIGANEGIFSIMMAKCFPKAKVIAYEPVPRTFDTLQENVLLNETQNLNCYQFGVGDGSYEYTDMIVSKDFSGGSTTLCTFNPKDHDRVHVRITTLNDIFDVHAIERCRLLKMDVEGMEYEALYATSVLPKVDYMVAEFHMNAKLDYQGMRADGLITWVKNQTNLTSVNVCRMAE